MKTPFEFIEDVCRSSKISQESIDRLKEITWAPDYAEPGYELGQGMTLLFGNWNDAHKWVQDEGWRNKADGYVSRVARVLEERYKCELEWNDEWSTCSECGKAFRIHPDSFYWEPTYKEIQGDWLCFKCAKEWKENE